jgi:RNA polymerase sigma-70 factor, ECF subfamily
MVLPVTQHYWGSDYVPSVWRLSSLPPSWGPAVSQTIPDLVQRAREGDRGACQALYESHLSATWGMCHAFARGRQELAADLCQDSFTTAFSQLDSLHEPERFSGWLKTITRRTCLRWAEKQRVEAQALRRLADEPAAGPSHTDHRAKVVSEVIAACRDDGLRQPAELFYGDPPLTTEDIATQLGLSRTAVTTRLHRFRTWARQRMLGRLAEALEDPA